MEKVKLKDVAKVIIGISAPKSFIQKKEFNAIPFIRAGLLEDLCNDKKNYSEYLNRENYKTVPKNTVVFAKSGMSAMKNRVYCLKEESVIVGHLAGIICKEDQLYFKYLQYYLKYNKISSLNQNDSYPSIRTEDIENIIINLPDIKLQHEIANKLEYLDNIIYMRKKQTEELEQLIKARFVELFGNTKNKITVGEICNVTGGYSFKSGDISNDGAIKILQIGNVYLDNVNWDTVNYLPEGYDEKYSRFLLNKGDIVVALTRPIIQSLGNVKACIVKLSDLPCLLNQRVGRIVPKEDKSVLLEFVYGCLMTDDFTRYVESCSIGCSQPNISTKDIENYLIPSATYEEQTEYVEFKKQTDKSKLLIQKNLEEIQKLQESLMKKYFG